MRRHRRRGPTIEVGTGTIEVAIIATVEAATVEVGVVTVVVSANHDGLKLPNQHMDLEVVILHSPLQRIIGPWEAELNAHPSKLLESSFDEHLDGSKVVQM
jgi:hypothetical protein